VLVDLTGDQVVVDLLVVEDATGAVGGAELVEPVELLAFAVAFVGVGEGGQVGAAAVLVLALERNAGDEAQFGVELRRLRYQSLGLEL
jgi:hypothetical protein